MSVKHYEKNLFGFNKDMSYKVWSVSVVEDADKVELIITHGKEGGKQQIEPEAFTEGKQGRNAVQQAVFEATSRVNKQLDKNYRETKEELDNLPVLAMLAKDASGAIEKIDCSAGVYTSDKFDGLRCVAKCFTLGAIELYSRTNQRMSIPHIERELAFMMNPGDILDGEIYYHGEVLQDIQSAAKRTDPQKEIKKAERALAKVEKMEKDPKFSDEDWYQANLKAEREMREALHIADLREKLEFHVFDIVKLGVEFSNRLADLDAYAKERFIENGFVQLVKYRTAFSHDELLTQHKDAVERGFEGLMVRLPKGLYESGVRSGGIWKLKAFLDAEFYIYDIVEDKKDGSIFCLKNNMIGDDCEIHEFSCVMGTIPERIERLANKDEYIGKYLTVQYQSRYKRTMLPQFPSGKAIREGGYNMMGEFVPEE